MEWSPSGVRWSVVTSRGVCDVTSHQAAPGTDDGVLLGEQM